METKSTKHFSMQMMRKVNRSAAMVLCVLVLGVGEMWGTEYYLLDHSGSSATFTGQFICNPATPTADARTISGQSFKGYVKTTGSMNTWSNSTAATKTIDYDVKTTSTTFTIYVGNTTTSTPQLYYVVYDESTEAHSAPDVVQTAIGDVIPKGNSTPQYTTRSVTITRSKNARVCFYTSQYNYTQIYQIVANETGTPLPKVGEGGYKLNLNKGRLGVNGDKYAKVDCNLELVGKDSYTMGNAAQITLAKSAIATQYISFTTQSKKCNLKLTYSNGTMAYNTSQSGDGATAITSETAYTLNGSTKYYLVNTSTKNGAPITLIEFECIAPTGLAASSATSSGATLTVTDAADINDYEFYISESSSAPNAATAATHTLTGGKTKVISDLSASTTYYAWVRSYYSANGKSSWVAGSSFTTEEEISGYSITYNCNDATSGCPSNANGQTALPNPLPSAPTKTGYTFKGWYTDEDFDDAAVAGATLSADATLYAKWLANPTSLTNGTTTYNSQEVSWTAGANEDMWEIFISTSSSTPADDEEEVIITNANSFTFEDLEETTTYYWWVRSLYDYGIETTAWVAGTSFTTAAANDYFYRGADNSWGSTAMTVSDGG